MNGYLKKNIISKVAPAVAFSGIHRLVSQYYGGIGLVLMFHRIIPESATRRVHNHLSLEITQEHLEKIITFFIRENYDFLSLNALYDAFKSGKFPDRKFVVVTFDDGYKDNLELALPVFRKYEIPFAVYITTGIPDKTAILWWYILEEMLLNIDAIQFEWKAEKFFCTSRTASEKEKAFELVQRFIHRHFDITDYMDLYKAIFKGYQSDLTSYSSELGMNWDEIRTLNKDPLVTIGAHTVNHFNLARLPGQVLKSEILDSKIILEQQLNQSIDHFAYPFGKTHHASEREFNCVSNVGFKTATTTRMGNLYRENSSQIYSLPRINVNRVTDKNVLKLQASGLLPLLVNKGKRSYE